MRSKRMNFPFRNHSLPCYEHFYILLAFQRNHLKTRNIETFVHHHLRQSSRWFLLSEFSTAGYGERCNSWVADKRLICVLDHLCRPSCPFKFQDNCIKNWQLVSWSERHKPVVTSGSSAEDWGNMHSDARERRDATVGYKIQATVRRRRRHLQVLQANWRWLGHGINTVYCIFITTLVNDWGGREGGIKDSSERCF